MNRANNINFLRLLLATLVIISHAQALPAGTADVELLVRLFHGPSLGDLAVDGFFVLSGYLITQSFARSSNWWTYLKKRIARIYPGFVVCALIIGLVVTPATLGWRAYYSVFPLSRFLADIVVLHFRSPQVMVQPWNFPIDFDTPLWTISVEFTGYLMVLLLGSLGLLKARQVVLLFLVATVLWWFSPRWEYYALMDYVPPVRMSCFFQYFFAGSFAWLWRDKIRYSKKGALLAALAVLVLLLAKRPGLVLLPVPLTYLTIYASFARAPYLEWFQNMPDISYGTYLYAWPIAAVLLLRHPYWPAFLDFVLTLPSAYICGFLSWHLVERPFLRRNRNPKASNSLSPTPLSGASGAPPG